MSTNRKIARAYAVLVAASVAGHALSLVKEMLGAGYFGISGGVDAFYAALTIPNLLSGVLLSPFGIIFIPIMVRLRSGDPESADRTVGAVANLLLLLLAAAGAAAFIFAGPAIKAFCPGLDGKTSADAVRLLRILSASIVFTGGANILTAVLNALEHFLWPAVSGMFITLCTIFLLFTAARTMGTDVLAWGLLAGSALQFAFLAPFALKHGFRWRPDLDLRHPEIRKSLKLAVMFLAISFTAGLNQALIRFVASWLPTGSIAALSYADKLVQVPLIIFSGSIAAAIYPFLAAQVAENRLEEMKDTVAMSLRMSGLIFMPVGALTLALAEPAVRLLYQRGAFDAAATHLTSEILLYYALQLFVNYALAVFMRLMFAFQDLKSVLKITAVSLAANAVLTVALVKLLATPAAGIALATSLCAGLSAVLYFAALKRRIQNLHGLSILRSLLRTMALSAPAGATAALAHARLAALLPAGIGGQSAALALAALLGLAVFTGLAAAFRLEELGKVLQLVRGRFRGQAREAGRP